MRTMLYETLIDEIIERLEPGNRALAVELAQLPERIRGFGHVKGRHIEAAKACEAELLARLRSEETGVAAGITR